MWASSLTVQLFLSSLGRALTQATKECVDFFLKHSLSLILKISSGSSFLMREMQLSIFS